MQRLRLSYLFIAAVFFLMTCGDVDNFSVTETSTTTIPKGSLLEQLGGDLGFGDFLNMDVANSEELKNQGVKKNQIDSVHLTSLTLTITNPPSGQDFSFLEELRFYVEAEGLERKLIASRTSFPQGVTHLEMDIEKVELKPYVAAPSMNITTESRGRRPDQDTTVEAEVVLDVDVDVSGAACGE